MVDLEDRLTVMEMGEGQSGCLYQNEGRRNVGGGGGGVGGRGWEGGRPPSPFQLCDYLPSVMDEWSIRYGEHLSQYMQFTFNIVFLIQSPILPSPFCFP